MKKKNLLIYSLLSIVLLSVVIILFSVSFAAVEEVNQIDIYSSTLDYNENESGSWMLSESGYWDLHEKMHISVEVNSRDRDRSVAEDSVFIVPNTPGVFDNQDTSQLFGDILVGKAQQNENNKLGAIVYTDTAEVAMDFNTGNQAWSVPQSSIVSYYNALKKLDELLEDYDHGDKPVNVYFLGNKRSLEKMNSAINYADMLKVKYPYIKLIGISFDTDYSLQELESICDVTYHTDDYDNNMDHLLRKVILNNTYSTFNIKEYVNSDDFTIDETSITTTKGTATVVGNVIEWDLSEEYTTGDRERLDYEITINNANRQSFKMFTATTNHEITTEIDGITDSVTSDQSVILNNDYSVTYLPNTPRGCTVTNMPSNEKRHVGTIYDLTDVVPECEGYEFKGWKQDTDELGGFSNYMYGHLYMFEMDVTFKAEWAKVSLYKKQTGDITSMASLYNLMAGKSRLDTTLDFTNPESSSLVNGVYEVNSTRNDEYPIYYYHGSVSDNNVLIANSCWRILRTTSTGGVKLIYNGVASDGHCDNDFATTSIGQTPYIKNTGENFYTVTEAGRNTYGVDYMMRNGFMPVTNSGYMYDDTDYSLYFITKNFDDLYTITRKVRSDIYTEYYADSVSYDPLYNSYTLINPSMSGSITYNDLIGKYTCSTTHGNYSVTSCGMISYYVESEIEGDEDYVYEYHFSNGLLEDSYNSFVMKFGDGIEYSDGEYHLLNVYEYNTLEKPIKDFPSDLDDYKYTCFSNEDHCSSVYYVISFMESDEDYLTESLELLAGEGLDNEVYQIYATYIDNDETGDAFTGMRLLTKYTDYNLYVSIVYSLAMAFGARRFFFEPAIELSEGIELSDIANEIHTSGNVKSSDLKEMLDLWLYNILVYVGGGEPVAEMSSSLKAQLATPEAKETVWSVIGELLEDTVYCNDRSFQISTSSNTLLDFASKTRKTAPDVSCSTAATKDKFSMFSANGNGDLIMPVGTITMDEINLTAWPEYKDSTFWTMSPAVIFGDLLKVYASSGHYADPYIYMDVKPVISLKAGMTPSSGVGTVSDPYVIENPLEPAQQGGQEEPQGD